MADNIAFVKFLLSSYSITNIDYFRSDKPSSLGNFQCNLIREKHKFVFILHQFKFVKNFHNGGHRVMEFIAFVQMYLHQIMWNKILICIQFNVLINI